MTVSILILEDETTIRENLAAYLEDEGFIVQQAESAEQALELLSDFSADLAIVDIRLPQMDGNEWMLKAHPLKPNMKFIVYTGYMEYKIPPALASLGLNTEQVLFKPVPNMEVISEAITQTLNS